MQAASPEVPPRTSAPGSDVSPGFQILVEGPGYEGFAVVDTLVQGRSSGGVRITSDLAVDEVRALAREMTHKYSLFLLPRGGAKAGLRLAPNLSATQRQAALEDFGRKLSPIVRAGIYYPGMDMNCGPEELRAIYRGVGHELGGAVTDTSWYTAMTVQHALEATTAALGISERPVTLAVEGFGRVARHLVSRLDPERYRVVAIATVEGGLRSADGFDAGDLLTAKDQHGDGLVGVLGGEATAAREVLVSEADLVLPSSRTWVIDAELAERMRTRAVVPISNAPYDDGAVAALHARGCMVLPGFVSNVGGVLASSLHDLGVEDQEIETLLEKWYRPIVDGLLGGARRTSQPLTEYAEAVAREHARSREPYPTPLSLPQKLYDRFLRVRKSRAARGAEARRDFISRSQQILAELANPEFLR